MLKAPPLGRLPDNAGRATPPAPRPSAPRTRRGPGQSAAAALLQPQLQLCRARLGAGAGAPSLPPFPAAMSQGSSGDWAPLEPTSGPPAPPNPFVHELRLSRLQRVKVRCGLGATGGPVGTGNRGLLELAKVGMGIRKGGG